MTYRLTANPPLEWPDHIGTEPGETCCRIEEPDENAPRGYRPKPCTGEMIQACGVVACDICGEMA